MRSLEAGRIGADDPELALHLERCLGCRGCEPVCPSGVGYGRGLETARAVMAERVGVPALTRVLLRVLTTPIIGRMAYAIARSLRATGIASALAGWGRLRFALGMIAATKPENGRRRGTSGEGGHVVRLRPASTVLLFRGCVMDGLFAHVHDATARVLAVNGYDVRDVPGQGCCGALHAHAGLSRDARALARANMAAFGGDAVIVTNSAGCGAMLKSYAHLFDGHASDADARSAAVAFSARVRDVTELLAERGPVPGAPLDIRVAYDPPCHLLHAQRIADAPLRLFGAIPVLRLVSAPDAALCCGGAGAYGVVQPEMSRAVLRPKLDGLRRAEPQVVASGNPGCLMQLGAGLRAESIDARVCHPVELLDQSYRAAGFYA
jgi:glycolate oxidase iron-sulfur subunit